MIGIDEVGRGSWAGPLLVVAARQLKTLPKGLADSKSLSRKRRELLEEGIKSSCDLGAGWVSAGEIDSLGLSSAMRLGVTRALEAINAQNDEAIIIDGLVNYCGESFDEVRCIAKADSLYPIVSAASVYAKVSRDRYMSNLDKRYAVYGFDRHVGYGTRLHADALTVHGISDQHRLSFAPIKQFITV